MKQQLQPSTSKPTTPKRDGMCHFLAVDVVVDVWLSFVFRPFKFIHCCFFGSYAQTLATTIGIAMKMVRSRKLIFVTILPSLSLSLSPSSSSPSPSSSAAAATSPLPSPSSSPSSSSPWWWWSSSSSSSSSSPPPCWPSSSSPPSSSPPSSSPPSPSSSHHQHHHHHHYHHHDAHHHHYHNHHHHHLIIITITDTIMNTWKPLSASYTATADSSPTTVRFSLQIRRANLGRKKRTRYVCGNDARRPLKQTVLIPTSSFVCFFHSTEWGEIPQQAQAPQTQRERGRQGRRRGQIKGAKEIQAQGWRQRERKTKIQRGRSHG